MFLKWTTVFRAFVKKQIETHVSSITGKNNSKGLSDKLCRQIVENSSEGICLVDLNGKVQAVNSRMCSMLGYPPDQIINRSVFEFMDDEAIQIAKKNLLKREQGISEQSRFCFRGKKISEIWVNSSSSPVYDTSGKVTGALGIFTDITSNKIVEDELNYFYNLPDHLLCIAGTDGYFKNCNPAFQKLLGYSQSELLSKPYVEFIHPDDVSPTAAETGHLNEGIETLKFENRYRCKNGSYRWFVWSANLIGTQVYCLARDITDYKIAEEKLKLREKYFREMCEVMPQIVWTSEPDGNLDFYNRHWFEYTGMTLEQTQGWGWGPVIHPDDLQNCIDRWTHAFTTGESYEVEYRFKRATDGQYRWHLGRALPMKDDSGRIVKWFGTCTDINDQKTVAEFLEKQVEERTIALKAANLALIQNAKMIALGEMASGVAHEINNPLAIITANVDLMKEIIKTAPINLSTLTKTAEKIEFTALRIAKIIDGLRTFSREGNNSPPEESSLKKIVDDTLEFCRERFRLNSVKLEVSEIPVDLRIICRPTQISQVLLNLLNNAFHAAENLEEKWVKIEFMNEDGQIKLSVTDSGRGISPEGQQKLFQPFFTTKPVGKGTGLGLSISKGIVESHQGKLILDQTCSNTRFTMSFPNNFIKQSLSYRDIA